MSQLKSFYNEQVVPKLKEKFNYSKVHQIPKLDKIVLNMGLGFAQPHIQDDFVQSWHLHRILESESLHQFGGDFRLVELFQL